MTCSKCLNCISNNASQASAKAVELFQTYPRLSISSPLWSNISHLTDLDTDLNMLADDNFSYYSTHDFYINNIAECFSNGQTFSIMNCNIRTLQANYDSLVHFLYKLYYPFSIIGLTQTKLMEGQLPITNTNLPEYSFISQPSCSSAGCVGFSVSKNLNYA